MSLLNKAVESAAGRIMEGAAVGAVVGGFNGAIFSDRGNRGTGAIGGAFAGMTAGALLGGGARIAAPSMGKFFRGNMDAANTAILQQYGKDMPNFSMPADSAARIAAMKKLAGSDHAMAGRARMQNRVHGGITNMLNGMSTTGGRRVIFASGAMLGGASFGAMFGGNRKSHARGFNSRRGNGFGR